MNNHLLIGLGGTGGLILKAFKKRLWREFPNDDAHGSNKDHAIAFLYVDSTDEMMTREDPSWKVYGETACFTESEFLNIRPDLSSLGAILNNIQAYPNIAPLVENSQAMNQRFGTISKAAGQMRRAGRIMFATNAPTFNQRVQNRYDYLRSITGEDGIHIMIFTGLCGGTGSGSIVDAICQCKKNYPSAEITVYAMYPEGIPPQGLDSGRYLQNGYAALKELNALNVGAWFPYDITTNGRRYSFPQKEKYFNLNLFSNVNEGGKTVESRRELPEVVANSVYFGLFLPRQNDASDYIRILEGENNSPEFYCEKNEVTGDPARTKAVNTFGIKRIVYPENRIREHIAYTFAQSIFNKMTYNAFRVGRGYTKDETVRDYTSYVKKPDYLEKWLLDDAHLILDKKIIESQEDFDSIEQIWYDNCHMIDYDVAESESSDDPLAYLRSEYVENCYKESFRDRQGVEKWYDNQMSDKLLSSHVKTIISAIEDDLHSKWVSDVEGFALIDLKNIADAILTFINEKKKDVGEGMVEQNNLITSYEGEAERLQNEFRGIFVGKLFNTHVKVYQDYQDCMQYLYEAKTRRKALDFKEALLIKLSGEFQAFVQDLDKFVSRLSEAQDMVISQIADRKVRDDKINIDNQVVEVSEDQKMVNFENKYTTDQTFIDKITGIFRKAITDNERLYHFGDVCKFATNEKVQDIVETILATEVVTAHNNDSVFQTNRILGMNVLQQLQKVVTGREALYKFALDLINHSKVLLEFDSAELTAQLMGNNIAPHHGTNIRKHCVYISFPSADGDDGLNNYAQQLENALRSACSAVNVVFDHNNPNKNEIAISVVQNLIPMRCIKYLSKFKECYDGLIASDIENALILHSEGNGSELPSLERETVGLSPEGFRPYLFLAAVNNIFKYGEDDKGYTGWLYVTKDKYGVEFKNLIGTKFTEIETSGNFTNEIRAEVTQKVNDLKSSFIDMHKADKDQMAQQIINLIPDHVAKEVKPGSLRYQEYCAAADEAVEILNH